MLHWKLAKLEGLETVPQWWNHKLLPSMCSNASKDFTIMTDRHLSHNRPDIVYVSSEKHVFLIDVAIPGDGRMAAKFQEKMQKYTDLKFEVRKMWRQPVSVVPVILGALGSVPPSLITSLKLLGVYSKHLVSRLQKSVLLSSTHILRRHLTDT